MNLNSYYGMLAPAMESLMLEHNIDKAIKAIQDSSLVITAGNGGSYASASHFTQDLMKAKGKESICLGDNTSYVLAESNDVSFSTAFIRPFYLHAKKNNVLFLISGSGNSQNIVTLAQAAKGYFGTTIVGLIGFDGGELNKLADISVYVPIKDMRLVESAHSLILHYIIDRM